MIASEEEGETLAVGVVVTTVAREGEAAVGEIGEEEGASKRGGIEGVEASRIVVDGGNQEEREEMATVGGEATGEGAEMEERSRSDAEVTKEGKPERKKREVHMIRGRGGETKTSEMVVATEGAGIGDGKVERMELAAGNQNGGDDLRNKSVSEGGARVLGCLGKKEAVELKTEGDQEAVGSVTVAGEAAGDGVKDGGAKLKIGGDLSVKKEEEEDGSEGKKEAGNKDSWKRSRDETT